MLLQHPFSQWTLSTLNAASSTITKLSLKLITKASSTWKKFSATLTLPLLREFSFINVFIPRDRDVASFVDIESFLVNHPRIVHICLHGVELPPSSKTVPRPSFQNLITFDAHPLYTVWLMNSLILSPTALPSLQRVVLSSKHYGHQDLVSSRFDSGLKAIAIFPRSIDLTLMFDWGLQFGNWIHSNVLAGVEKSPISRLVHTDTFSIYCGGTEYTEDVPDNILEWIRLFPALKHLGFNFPALKQFNMVSQAIRKRLVEPQYVANVSLLCQKLETLSVNWEMFDLRLIRSNVESGAGA